MVKKRKTRKAKVKTTSFKSFEKIPFSETINIRGKVFETSKFFNRDMSWLAFNERVLYEFTDERNPLLERLRFLDIFRSNNDEFFMKRVGLLISKIQAGNKRPSLDGRNSLDLYNEFLAHIRKNWQEADIAFKTKTIPDLEKSGIKFFKWKELSYSEKNVLKEYYKENIFPILTPLAVDAGHPFPFISNLSKSVGVCLKRPGQKGKYFARVKLPPEIDQWIELKSNSNFMHRYINIEEIIQHNIKDLFPGMTILSSVIFRVTRDATMDEDDDHLIENVLEWVTEGLKERKFSPVVRLEIDNPDSEWLIRFLKSGLEVVDEQVFAMPSLICYSSFSNIIDLNIPELRFNKFQGQNYLPFENIDNDSRIFNEISKKDHLIHLPYQTYLSTVESFLVAASQDSKVRAIKIILYRTDADGRLIDILLSAVERGIQVAVIIELKARFDEASNIKWAHKLEDAGIHVSYGTSMYKTHAKMIMVVRQEAKKLKTYVNIGTGNFNGQTSKHYTDLSLFTCRKPIVEEVVNVFNYLTGRCLEGAYKKLLVAPFNMSRRFIQHINNEGKNALQGKPAEIIAKMNQLEDPFIIDALYKASQDGVKITLLIRGFCCLKPGVKGLSENIKVVSLIGRLLEHTRIFYFRNAAPVSAGGIFYIGSADWMSRNLHARIEVITPILSQEMKDKLLNILEITLKDNQNVWELTSKGMYNRRQNDKRKFIAQEWFIENKKEL